MTIINSKQSTYVKQRSINKVKQPSDKVIKYNNAYPFIVRLKELE